MTESMNPTVVDPSKRRPEWTSVSTSTSVNRRTDPDLPDSTEMTVQTVNHDQQSTY